MNNQLTGKVRTHMAPIQHQEMFHPSTFAPAPTQVATQRRVEVQIVKAKGLRQQPVVHWGYPQALSPVQWTRCSMAREKSLRT